jgi:hypothetical protein
MPFVQNFTLHPMLAALNDLSHQIIIEANRMVHTTAQEGLW